MESGAAATDGRIARRINTCRYSGRSALEHGPQSRSHRARLWPSSFARAARQRFSARLRLERNSQEVPTTCLFRSLSGMSEALRAIKFPDDYEVRVALDIAETRLKFWAYFEGSFRLMLRAQPFGISLVLA